MPQAIWKNVVLAESNQTVVVEGNHYFPKGSINQEYFHESDWQTQCPWKGTASYYSIFVDGQENKDAAWYYQQPSEAASEIKGYVAFGNGVQIVP